MIMNPMVLALCFLVLVALTQGDQVDPQNVYILTFQYAARNVPPTFDQNKLTAIFNNQIIASINAADNKVVTVSFNLPVLKGVNYLKFSGNGNPLNRGISIDNVQLFKKGSTANVLENGDFQLPKLVGLQQTQNIPGWTSDNLIKINAGSTYNPGWNSRVLWFGSDKVQKNYIISQQITFDNEFNHIPPYLAPIKIRLEVDYCYRQGMKSNTSQATIIWNGVVIDTLMPSDDAKGINYAVYEVNLVMGDNELVFDGNSLSDGFGISIGQVLVGRKDKVQNLVENFDFREPYVAANQTKFFKGGIKGWKGTNLEIGDCRVYNIKWRGGQCIQLDSDKNQRYIQVIKVDWYLYKKLRDGLPIN